MLRTGCNTDCTAGTLFVIDVRNPILSDMDSVKRTGHFAVAEADTAPIAFPQSVYGNLCGAARFNADVISLSLQTSCEPWHSNTATFASAFAETPIIAPTFAAAGPAPTEQPFTGALPLATAAAKPSQPGNPQAPQFAPGSTSRILQPFHQALHKTAFKSLTKAYRQ